MTRRQSPDRTRLTTCEFVKARASRRSIDVIAVTLLGLVKMHNSRVMASIFIRYLVRMKQAEQVERQY
jgi:hypothetical protein